MRRGSALLARCLYSAPAARAPPHLPRYPAVVGWPLCRECEQNMLTLHDWWRASNHLLLSEDQEGRERLPTISGASLFKLITMRAYAGRVSMR